MSLKQYLKDCKIDQIEDDQEFMEAEYDAIQEYCEYCGYCITADDFEIVKSRGRGLEDSFIYWKDVYVKDLWEEFGNIPINPNTEEIDEPWKHFLSGTHRKDIWHWFEEQFDISVAELMRQ